VLCTIWTCLVPSKTACVVGTGIEKKEKRKKEKKRRRGIGEMKE